MSHPPPDGDDPNDDAPPLPLEESPAGPGPAPGQAIDAAVSLAGKLGVGLADLAQAASPALLADSFAVPEVVGPEDDPDVPRLPYSMAEPDPVSSLDPAQLRPDLEMLARLRRNQAEPDARGAARAKVGAALTAALDGRPYDVEALPESRALAIAVMRVLVAGGVDKTALVDAVLDALNA